MSEALVAEARRSTGITSDSNVALAVGAELGAWLLAQRGRLPRDFQLQLWRSTDRASPAPRAAADTLGAP